MKCKRFIVTVIDWVEDGLRAPWSVNGVVDVVSAENRFEYVNI